MGRPYKQQFNKLNRELDPLRQQAIKLNLTQPQIHLVNRLYKTGCFGNAPAQVVHRLFGEACLHYADKHGIDLLNFPNVQQLPETTES